MATILPWTTRMQRVLWPRGCPAFPASRTSTSREPTCAASRCRNPCSTTWDPQHRTHQGTVQLSISTDYHWKVYCLFRHLHSIHMDSPSHWTLCWWILLVIEHYAAYYGTGLHPWYSGNALDCSNDLSCARGMIHDKIHLICPSCLQGSLALQCTIVA